MLIQSNKVNFTQYNQNRSQKSDSENNALLNMGITIVAAGAGTATGYYIYHNDKIEIKSKINAANYEAQKVKPENIDKVKKDLDNSFYDLVELNKKQKHVVFPNCIMLTGGSPVMNKHLIQDMGYKTDCNFIEIKNTDDVLEHLEKAEANYNGNSKRTLLFVENFEDLINPSKSPEHQISGFKDIMGSASDEYHSTIIFTTKDPLKLDPIAIQDHRVQAKIDVNVNPDEYSKYLEKSIDADKVSKNYWGKPAKSKIWTGALIGFAIGALSVGIKHLNSNNNKTKE